VLEHHVWHAGGQTCLLLLAATLVFLPVAVSVQLVPVPVILFFHPL
jgi:hypothetical protein